MIGELSGRVSGYAGLAETIREFKDKDEILCTRLIPRTIQQLKLLKNKQDILAFYQQPPTSGDKKWDALIAGVAVHTWSLAGYPGTPEWTAPLRPLDDWWEPGAFSNRWTFWNMVHTPASLRERKVIFPSQWLDAV